MLVLLPALSLVMWEELTTSGVLEVVWKRGMVREMMGRCRGVWCPEDSGHDAGSGCGVGSSRVLLGVRVVVLGVRVLLLGVLVVVLGVVQVLVARVRVLEMLDRKVMTVARKERVRTCSKRTWCRKQCSGFLQAGTSHWTRGP